MDLIGSVVQYMDYLDHHFGGQHLNGGALLSWIEKRQEKKAGVMASSEVGIVLDEKVHCLVGNI